MERAFRRPEKTRFGLQRCHNELTSEFADFGDETLQPLHVELRSGIVQKQRRSGPALILQQAQLRERHGDRHELLLPARQDLPCGPTVEPYRHVSAVRPGVGELPELITLARVGERLDQAVARGSSRAGSAG